MVIFYFPPQYQVNRARFSFLLSIYIQFLHKLEYFIFLAFSEANFLSELEKSAHIFSSGLSTVLQITNNLSTSTINERFNIFRTKYQFSNNHQMIETPFNWSTQ